MYSAVYDFERELESEMTIASGEFVTVYDREFEGWVCPLPVSAGVVGTLTGVHRSRRRG